MTALPLVAKPLALVPALSRAAAAAMDITPGEIIARWLSGLSPSATRSYRRSVARFADWLLVDGGKPEQALEALCRMTVGQAGECLVRWRDELLAEGLATGSVGGYLTGVLSMLAACRRAGLVAWRLEKLAPKVERRLDRSGPRRFEVEALFADLDARAATGHRQAIRDAALVRLLYCAALRRSEAVGLRLEDVELDADLPVVKPRRKGHRERKPVGISPGTVQALRRWIELRGQAPGWLFFKVKEWNPEIPLSGESVRRLLRTLAKRAGVKHAVRPHGLRHSSATEVAKRGSLAQLMALGGWSSLSAAQRYLDEQQETRRSALALVDL